VLVLRKNRQKEDHSTI